MGFAEFRPNHSSICTPLPHIATQTRQVYSYICTSIHPSRVRACVRIWGAAPGPKFAGRACQSTCVASLAHPSVQHSAPSESVPASSLRESVQSYVSNPPSLPKQSFLGYFARSPGEPCSPGKQWRPPPSRSYRKVNLRAQGQVGKKGHLPGHLPGRPLTRARLEDGRAPSNDRDKARGPLGNTYSHVQPMPWTGGIANPP